MKLIEWIKSYLQKRKKRKMIKKKKKELEKDFE